MNLPRSRATRLLALLCALALVAPTALARQAGQTLKLAKIEFDGLARVRPEEALSKSGLQTGQPATVEAVEEAATRLMQSGLFRNLSFSIKGTTDAATVIFKVEEMRFGVPVVFDNFVWFSDEELTEAVRRQVPSFDGTAPETGGVTEEIVKALQELLRARKLPGAVEYMPSADPSGRNAEHVFTVKGADLRVCALSFPGSRSLAEAELVGKSGAVFDNEYSRTFVRGFVESSLLPLYHERGHLRAAFAPLKVSKAPETPDCKQGLNVTVPVDEGSIYVWAGAEWSGNQALTAQELDAALGMKTREAANAVKFAKGLDAVRKAYGRKGHLTARLGWEQEFDDAGRRVTYRLQVAEGPQYRMGALHIKGLDERETNDLRVRWRLLPGDVYDDGYAEQFLKKNLTEYARELMTREGRRPTFNKVDRSAKADHDKLTVDVTLDFKQAAAPQQ